MLQFNYFTNEKSTLEFGLNEITQYSTTHSQLRWVEKAIFRKVSRSVVNILWLNPHSAFIEVNKDFIGWTGMILSCLAMKYGLR